MYNPNNGYALQDYFLQDYVYMPELILVFNQSLNDSVTATESMNIVFN